MTNPNTTGTQGGRAARGGPLAGIKVVDLSAYLAGPYGCTLLADLGADVIKIEPPDGDNIRKYPSTLQQEGRAYLGANRNKRGIVLDLKREEGKAVMRRLVETADVLVHNFRPAVPARLGIDYATLKAINPRLVYCAVTGYGDTGPLKDKAGYDQVLQSMTGICALQGQGSGAPQVVLGSIVDYYAASMVAFGVSAALFRRERSGEGDYVGVSLLRSALTMQSARFIWADGEPREAIREFGSGGITGLHPTREGSIYISANTPHFWETLCRLVDLPELAVDPRYDTIRKRAWHAEELVPRLRTALMRRTALEWEELFGDEVPCATARTIEDMFEHPQVLAEGMVTDFVHPSVGRYRGLQEPVRFGAARCARPFAAPTLGQHTEQVLGELGYTAADMERLRASAVLGGMPANEKELQP
jgi:formyl-CoA transferase